MVTYGAIPKWAFLMWCAVSVVLLSIALIAAARSGNWLLTMVVALIASPIQYCVLRIFFERGSFGSVFNPHTQSWAFLGDFALAISLGFIAQSWYIQSHPDWATSWGWTLGCIGVGIAISMTFRMLDVKAYAEAGESLRANDPTKLFHDFVSYPVLAGSLLCVGLPLIIRGVNSTFPYVQFQLAPLAGWVIGLVAVWALAGVLDVFVHKPAPAELHPVEYFWPKSFLAKMIDAQ